MCCTFNESYSALPQEFLRNRKRPHTEESLAISFPWKTLKRISYEVGIKISSTYKITKNNLYLIPYKIRVVQQLLPPDYLKRKMFAPRLIRQFPLVSDLLYSILFSVSDQGRFYLYGWVIKQNFTCQTTENQEIIKPIPLHSKQLTFWCEISLCEIFRP